MTQHVRPQDRLNRLHVAASRLPGIALADLAREELPSLPAAEVREAADKRDIFAESGRACRAVPASLRQLPLEGALRFGLFVE